LAALGQLLLPALEFRRLPLQVGQAVLELGDGREVIHQGVLGRVVPTLQVGHVPLAGAHLGHGLVHLGLGRLLANGAFGGEPTGPGQLAFLTGQAGLQLLAFLAIAGGQAALALGLPAQQGKLVLRLLDGALSGQAALPSLGDLLLGGHQIDAQGLQVSLQAGDALVGQEELGAQGLGLGPGLGAKLLQAGVLVAGDGQVHLPDAPHQLLVGQGLLGLPAQPLHLGRHLVQDVLQPVQVDLGLVHLALGDLALVLEAGDAGGLLHPQAAVLGLGLDEGRYLALLDDGISAVAQAGVHEQLLDVFQSTGHLVDEVVAVPVAVEPAGHHDLRQVGELAGGHRVLVVEDQGDLGQAGALAAGGTVEDDVLHGVAAQGLGRLLPQHPAHGIHHVGLAAAVGSHHGAEALGKIQDRTVGEGLEAGDLQPLDLHGLPRA
jgi:hypothetical protein